MDPELARTSTPGLYAIAQVLARQFREAVGLPHSALRTELQADIQTARAASGARGGRQSIISSDGVEDAMCDVVAVAALIGVAGNWRDAGRLRLARPQPVAGERDDTGAGNLAHAEVEGQNGRGDALLHSRRE
jgi:hypothetical protein